MDILNVPGNGMQQVMPLAQPVAGLNMQARAHQMLGQQVMQQAAQDNATDDSGTDTDDEGRLIQQAEALRKEMEQPKPLAALSALARGGAGGGGAGAGAKATAKRPAGAVTLRTLIEAGLLVPGTDVLIVDYKGMQTYGDLLPDGLISCNGQMYESPSAFSIFIKRQVNPDRKADDGWKAVRYRGKLLEAYKNEYLNRLGSQMERSVTPGLSAQQGTGSVAGASAGTSPAPSTHNSPSRDGGADEPSSKRARLECGLADFDYTAAGRQQDEWRTDSGAAGPSTGPGEASAGGASGGQKPAFKLKLKVKGQGEGSSGPPSATAAGPAAGVPAGLAQAPQGGHAIGDHGQYYRSLPHSNLTSEETTEVDEGTEDEEDLGMQQHQHHEQQGHMMGHHAYGGQVGYHLVSEGEDEDDDDEGGEDDGEEEGNWAG